MSEWVVLARCWSRMRYGFCVRPHARPHYLVGDGEARDRCSDGGNFTCELKPKDRTTRAGEAEAEAHQQTKPRWHARALRRRESPALTVVARTLTSNSLALGWGVGTSSILTTSGGP